MIEDQLGQRTEREKEANSSSKSLIASLVFSAVSLIWNSKFLVFHLPKDRKLLHNTMNSVRNPCKHWCRSASLILITSEKKCEQKTDAWKRQYRYTSISRVGGKTLHQIEAVFISSDLSCRFSAIWFPSVQIFDLILDFILTR